MKRIINVLEVFAVFKLIQIDLPYACFGIELDHSGKCINAAPIGKWMIGKDKNTLFNWVIQKNGIWIHCPRYK